MSLTEAGVRHEAVAVAQSRGWSLWRNYLSGAEAAALKADVLRLVADPDAPGPALCFFSSGSAGQGRRLTRVERIWDALPVLTESPLGADLAAIAAAYLDEKAVLFKDKLNIRHVGSPGYPPHQDAAGGWEEFSDRFVTFGLFLGPSDRAHGGFEVAGHAHRRGRLPNVRGAMSAGDFEALEPQVVEAGPGDLLVLDGETPHRSARNEADTDSLHLLLTFTRAGAEGARHAYYARMASTVATLTADGRFTTTAPVASAATSPGTPRAGS